LKGLPLERRGERRGKKTTKKQKRGKKNKISLCILREVFLKAAALTPVLSLVATRAEQAAVTEP